MNRLSSIFMRASLSALAIIGLSAITARAQTGYPASTPRDERRPDYIDRDSDAGRRVIDPGRSSTTRRFPSDRTVYYPRPVSAPRPPTRKLSDEEKQQLYPSATERAALASTLKQSGTGIARLLPDAGCKDAQGVVYVKGSCLDKVPPVPGGGSFYSFKRKDHELKRRSDLWLENGQFRVRFTNVAVGVIAALGDVPLDMLTLDSSAVSPLLPLAPTKTRDELLTRYEHQHAALAAAPHAYRESAPVRVNTTYIVRSTLYDFAGRKPTDALVAFRVTRAGADGSVTIVWKQLQKPKG